MTLQEVQQAVAGHMEEIQSYFKAGHKITLLVRNPTEPEQDFVMTDDDLGAVVEMIERRRAKGPDS